MMSVLATVRPRFDALIEQGLLKEGDLLRAAAEAHEQHLNVEQVIMRRFKISKARLGAALERHYNCPYVAFDPRVPAPQSLLRNLKPSYLRTDLWVPLGMQGGRVTVLIDDPNHLIKRDNVHTLLPSAQIEYCVGLREDIEAYIDHFFGRGSGALPPVTPPPAPPMTAAEPSVEVVIEATAEHLSEEEAAAALLDGLLKEAALRGATTIHLAPRGEDGAAEVRLRVDGRSTALRVLSRAQHAALATRVKALANLDTTEQRLPQQGPVSLPRPSGTLELRVATVPTLGGHEDVVLRVRPSGAPASLEDLQFAERTLAQLRALLGAPRGLLVVTGPAGSGRTTTLHAALRHLIGPDRSIWTVEDPIEFAQPGLRQVQLQPKLGLTAAAALRALLEVDADAVLLGELRDGDACALALEGALGGQLVLCGMRTAGAAEAIGRLLDLGAEPLPLSDALLGVLAQRLVRRLCEGCREIYAAGEDEVAELRAALGEEAASAVAAGTPLYRTRGCGECRGTGYRGRLALHELIEPSDALRRLVAQRRPVEDLRAQARRDGALSLRRDGAAKVLLGLTELGELRSV